MSLLAMSKSVPAIESEGVKSCHEKPYFEGMESCNEKPCFEGEETCAYKSPELWTSEMDQDGRDYEVFDAFEMMLLMEDTSTILSPNAFLEDMEPLQGLNGSSSPPPLLGVSCSDSRAGELSSSTIIPDAPCSALRDQAHSRIWGVRGCNNNQKRWADEKKSSMQVDVELEGNMCKTKRIARNLVADRRRRKKLNDKLFSLRALVPNISKMDRASIIADAISYLKELKRKVKEMETQLAATKGALATGLQRNKSSIIADAGKGQKRKVRKVKEMEMGNSHLATTLANGLPPPKFISMLGGQAQQHVVKFTMTHMEGKTYHLQIDCKRNIGVCLQLAQAVEALGCATISANFCRVNNHILNNLTIEVENENVLSEEELRKKIMEVMLRFGFIF